jgi:hypothetical protein
MAGSAAGPRFGSAYGGLTRARAGSAPAGPGGYTTQTRVPGTVDQTIGPGGLPQSYTNPQYGANMEQAQIQARPDGTYVQTDRKFDPTTGTYATLGVKEGGGYRKQKTTTEGGPGGLDDLNINDYYKAKGMIPNLPPREKPPSQADRTAQEAAAYGRAKDKIGLNAQAGLRAMQGLMASRGISGSGIEAALSQGVVGDAVGQLGEVGRDQAITGLKRDWDVEDRDWAGNIQQRGQDISGLSSRNADVLRLMEATRTRRRDTPATTTTENWAY